MNKKKKILFVITGFNKSGAETQLFNLISNIKDDYDIRVVGFVDGYFFNEYHKLGVDVVVKKISSLLGFKGAISFIRNEIKSFSPDLVHSWLPHANIVTKLSTIGLRDRPKVICSVRVKEIKFLIYNILELLTSKLSDKVVCNSKSIKDYLVGMGFSKRKVDVINNGVILRKPKSIDLHKSFKIPKNKKIVVTVANFRAQKDYVTNLKTCKELLTKRDDFSFLYVGDGETKQKIESLSETMDLTKHVFFAGRRADAIDILNKSDVFFLPTLYEGQSNSVLESMCYKIPIVTTNIAENEEFLDNYKDAFLCDRKDYKAMANRIDELLSIEKTANNFVSKSYKKSKKYDNDVMVNNYKKLYGEFI